MTFSYLRKIKFNIDWKNFILDLHYRYSLPEGSKPEDVSSNLAADGILVVTAKKAPAIDVQIQQQSLQQQQGQQQEGQQQQGQQLQGQQQQGQQQQGQKQQQEEQQMQQ
jgi:hypothetical protein